MVENPFLQAIITYVMGGLPVIEARGAIPIALARFDLPLKFIFPLAIAGNLTVVALLLKFLPPLVTFAENHWPWLHKKLQKILKKTHTKHSKKFNEVGAIFLVSFIAIPLPVTGGWTGAMIAYLFGIPFKKALILLSLGILISGTLVSVGIQSITQLIHLITT